jgi:hypothetical protein
MEHQRLEAWKTRPHLNLISLLGEGQFGGVYHAENDQQKTKSAVKVISLLKLLKSKLDIKKITQIPDFDKHDAQLMDIVEELVSEYLLEVRQISRVSSENVVECMGHWLEGPQASNLSRSPPDIESMISSLQSDVDNSIDTFCYIEMELCGTTLEKWLHDQVESENRKNILKELRKGALIQITSGLNDLHKEGIVHCDLKPDNILLHEKDGKFTFKIADFGNSMWFEYRGLDFLNKVKEDIELLAIRVFKVILETVEQVHTDGEFYRENTFVKCTEEKDKVYFRDCTCTFLIEFLTSNTCGDPDSDKHILKDQHNFEECYQCIFDYWSRDFLSKYQTIELYKDTLELKDKVNNEEVFKYQIKVANGYDARYSFTVLKSCLRTAGLQVVILEGRKLLELDRQGHGSSIIDYLRDSGTNLLVLSCCQVDESETSLLINMCDNLDRESINTLVVAAIDMVGKHGGLIDVPKVDWHDLTDFSKTQLLKNKMNLHGKELVLEKYLNELDSECLRLVLSDPDGDLKIPTGTRCVLPQPYIPRTFRCIKSRERIDDTGLCKGTERLVILSDSPGSGKSTVLSQLIEAFSQLHGVWTHVIRLNEFVDDIEKWEPSNMSVESFLLQITFNNGQFHSLFKSTLEQKTKIRLVLLFDAIDEVLPNSSETVLPDSSENVTLLLKHLIQQSAVEKIIVTTRPHMLPDLQEVFNTFCVELEPLSIEEQIQYIVAVWGDTAEDQVVDCISNFNDSCANGYFEDSPLEDPMILKLLAEQTKTDKIFSGSVRELYSAVVGRKINESIKEKLGVNSEGKGIGAKHEMENLRLNILCCLQWLALQIVNFRGKGNAIFLKKPLDWNEDRLKRTLLIEGCGERIFFLNLTFAEYLFASMISDSINDMSTNQLVELTFSRSLQTVRNFMDERKLNSYFTEDVSIPFWNYVIEKSPEVIQNQYCSLGLMKKCPTEAVVHKSLLLYSAQHTIIRFLCLDTQNCFLRKNMSEWEWVLRQLTEKVGSEWTAEVFFKSYGNKGEHVHFSLWNEVLLNEEGFGELKYAHKIWEWLRSDSEIEEDKPDYILRGEGDTGWPSLFWVVKNRKAFEFFTELIIPELSLSPARLRNELMFVADKPHGHSNWLHAAASSFSEYSYIEPPPLSAIVEFGRKYLSNEDFDRLLFQGSTFNRQRLIQIFLLLNLIMHFRIY